MPWNVRIFTLRTYKNEPKRSCNKMRYNLYKNPSSFNLLSQYGFTKEYITKEFIWNAITHIKLTFQSIHNVQISPPRKTWHHLNIKYDKSEKNMKAAFNMAESQLLNKTISNSF